MQAISYEVLVVVFFHYGSNQGCARKISYSVAAPLVRVQ
jgi:hypothetical protein